MSLTRNQSKYEIIEKIINQANSKLTESKASLVSEFIRQFLGTVAVDDLLEHSVSDLYGSMLSFWNFIFEREPKQTKVHIFNPDYEAHGWQSTHTIIQIIQDDMPFLVDSTLMEINRLGLTAHLIIHAGGMKIERNTEHHITRILKSEDAPTNSTHPEAPIMIEIDRQNDVAELEKLQQNLLRILSDVRIAVEDWQAVRARVKEALTELETVKKYLDVDEFDETKDFLNWIIEEHFTFLGCRDYDLVTENDEKILRLKPETGLGVLRDTSTSTVSRSLAEMTPEARKLSLSNQILIISKTNTISTVHRATHTDYIGIKRFNEKGEVIGERRIIGLYTSAAYNTSPRHIPFLRRKVALIMKNSKLLPKSHAGKTLLNILETLPRDDLFQGNPDELLDMALGIFHLQERRRIRMFIRKDVYNRFISCLVYAPRDRVNTELRQTIEDILLKEFSGTEINFSTRFTDSVLARIHFIIRINPKKKLTYDLNAIEQKIIEAGRIWQDDLVHNLIEVFGEEKGNRLINRYASAFPSSYREAIPARQATYDIKNLEMLSENNTLVLNFYAPVNGDNGKLRLKVYQHNNIIPLSDVLPILENMGLRVISENPYEIKTSEDESLWINDFGMVPKGDYTFEVELIKEKFQEGFSHIWFKMAENDGFNKLILAADINWREVSVIRTYAKYFRQIGLPFSQEYIETALANNPLIASNIIELFKVRFDPAVTVKDPDPGMDLTKSIKDSLNNVTSLDEDRIIRRYVEAINATLRTNYFQESSKAKDYLSIKLDPSKIQDLPLPKPMFEIFVYSPRFEGVHLRAAKVARGGLRWSDRREDFRTEILGLMRTQTVKNAVIVPSGAKGGFVPKLLPVDGTRDEIMEEAIACYQNFIRGLLDITDNHHGETIIKPLQVVCYDDDDPYLVVAADKGTASFSDIANSIAEEYNFWLGDAFASGGSAGYDHKKMGITARGAWESVKRHFRELGIDMNNSDFTVTGIGDMAGDVFGNGMLLSHHIKLIAAFNHEHIFIDPNPDSEISFKERQRLFNLPQSRWSDYDATLISQGGGVYSRKAKTINLTAEIKQALKLELDSLEPNELIREILKAPVDLLWNGGIGTFVRSSTETNSDVGDRSNDAIRVRAEELRCKVIGEGGNLGLTQLARIEYSITGGRLYTDFIDNSGGVDCSDHEVNIKILLNSSITNGDLTVKQRNQLLVQMTDEVSSLVLHDNYRQSQAISLAAYQAPRHVDLHSRYITVLEQSGKLDRKLEFLPDEKTLTERKLEGLGLSRPGLAVLFAYSKNILKDSILKSDVPEDPFLSHALEKYFPQPLQKKYHKEMQQHRLRREIIATQMSNDLINEMGFTFAFRLYDETGASVPTIVTAYLAAKHIFGLESLWTAIESLDFKVSCELQMSMMLHVSRLMRRATRWLIKNRRTQLNISSAIKGFAPGIKHLKENLSHYLRGDEIESYQQIVDEYVQADVPIALAKELAASHLLQAGIDIIDAANSNNYAIDDVACVYFAVGDILDLGWIRSQIIAQPITIYWEALSREALRDDLEWQQRLLTISILKHKSRSKDLDKRLTSWQEQYADLILRWQKMLASLRASAVTSFTMYFVAIRELLDLTQTSLQATNEEITDKEKEE